MENLGDWTATKRRLQQRWPGLEDDELEASEGDRSALVALLQGRFGYAQPNAEQDIDQILSGETVIPEDVADEATHTGTSGPVGPVSPATDFTGADSRKIAVNNGSWNHEPAPTPIQSRASTTDAPSSLADYTEEPWETGAPPASGVAAENQPGQYLKRGGDRARMLRAAGVVATAAAALLLVGIWLKRRKENRRTSTEKLVHQARELSDKLSERTPKVDELRDKLSSLDARTLRSPKTRGLIGAAVALLSAGILIARRAGKNTQTERVVKQADELSREISALMVKMEALRTDLRSLDDDARGKRRRPE